MKHSEQLSYRALAAYTEGEVAASEAASIEEALLTSQEGRQRLSRINSVEAALRDIRVVEDIELLPSLLPRLEAARRSTTQASGRPRPAFRIAGPVAAAATVVLLVFAGVLLFRQRPSATSVDEYRVKSAASASDVRSRWIAFNAFRLSGEAQPEQVTDTLRSDDGLLFSYTNLGPEPFSYILIFGVDANRRVYWYYPAFLDHADNPKSISIAKDVSRAGLREVIAHPYTEGSLTLFSLFSDKVLSVSDIEAAVTQGVDDVEGFEATFDNVRAKALFIKVLP